MDILIRKVKDLHGWLGNMSPYPIEFNGKLYRTTEALFQALRFSDEEVIEAIRAEKSPMAAKFAAKRPPEEYPAIGIGHSVPIGSPISPPLPAILLNPVIHVPTPPCGEEECRLRVRAFLPVVIHI